jgi:hypothetical protein
MEHPQLEVKYADVALGSIVIAFGDGIEALFTGSKLRQLLAYAEWTGKPDDSPELIASPPNAES